MSKGNQIAKDAIAEAKVIRATALEQAKLALEEAFTPHLQSILAAKLNELEEEENISENSEEMEETIDLEALLAEEDGEDEMGEEEEMDDEDKDISSMSPQEVEDYIRQIAAEEFTKLEAEQGEEGEEDEMGEEAPEEESDDEEEINLDEIFNESDDQDEDDETMNEEIIDENDIDIDSLLAEFGLSEEEETTKPEMDEELSQALVTIDELRSTLHEVNLLNAKLLYMNKLFKSNNLTESQKIQVVKTFDKTESVRETKLVYESLNSTLTKKIDSKTPIKESLGFASKASGLITNTSNNKVIESDVQIDRWAKLAGLK